MTKQKKTALDCVLSDLSSGDNDWCSSICPVRNKCSTILCREDCIEKLKNHYKQQATIPDGWDIVKKIYAEYKQWLNEWNKVLGEPDNRTYQEGNINALAHILETISRELSQAGIEVE